MREIKFRAWQPKSKKMLDLQKITPLAISPGIAYEGVFVPFTNDVIVMQFTGALSDDKVEIYEGDILENGNGVWLEVYWNEDFLQFKQRVFNKRNVESLGYEWQEDPKDRTDVDLRFNFKKIIGNIYENPELLK
jgi:uncharacterized phage protein (TIGR01671 family)